MAEHDPLDVRGLQSREADRRHEAAVDNRVCAEDWTWLLASKRGRRIVADILDVCGVDTPSYTGSAETYYREGRRSIGLYIQRQAKLMAPDHYFEMLKDSQ